MDYYFNNGKFIIDDYDKKSTFASFLPGVAGKLGKPIWCYYVNRGQVVSSFGVGDKGSPILEFSPASIAYQLVSSEGFRTFLKVNGEFVEPFAVSLENDIKRRMEINESSVGIYEKNTKMGYEIRVQYFGLPEDEFAALVRTVEITNISDKEMNIEVLDGLTTIIPKGVSNSTYKEVGNLMRSWMDVENLENDIAFYKLRASSSDQAEVNQILDGNFFLTLVDDEIVSPIVDAKLIFDFDDSLSKPVAFMNQSLEEIMKKPQVTANKVPCGFSAKTKVLKSQEVISIGSMYGYVEDVQLINSRKNTINKDYFKQKQKAAYDVIRNLTNDIYTKTNNTIFDEYCRQSYLDNFIRGGYPILLDNNKDGVVYYLYSRKHGDLERDYNWFTIAPEYYSQGNGNYRDANQNRRNDCLFKKYVKDYDIKQFMNLVQIDGYNPLSVNGVNFHVTKENAQELIGKIINVPDQKLLSMLNSFTPGAIINYLSKKTDALLVNLEEALKIILEVATYDFEANFGEGYWSDHWTYNFDLVENYLKVYPDYLKELMFEDHSYKYFQSPVTVLPRSEKYVLNKENQVRQYGAINHHDNSKCQKLNIGMNVTNWLKDSQNKIYYTNLFEKMLSLAVVKFSTLDSYGIGIEMEGEKPGWNDAMNGLPGLFGSGVSETLELIRIVRFLKKISLEEEVSVAVLDETKKFADRIFELLKKYYSGELNDFNYWDLATEARENFRAITDITVSGEKVTSSIKDYLHLFELMETKLNDAVIKAFAVGNGILPTYLVYEASQYEFVVDQDGNKVMSHYGLPKVKVKEFTLKQVPLFLEAPARSYKVLDQEKILTMHYKIKDTDLYDKKLKTYRTSVDLDAQSLEMGRIRAFTKGWLERESCFLHMTYKYLWGLLSAGLYEEFFEELRTNLVANLDPNRYGRSILENSSFIATSCNPDSSTHGKGYVSRLTGANVEFLSMWNMMMFGKNVFKMEQGKLVAEFNPILKGDMFDNNDEVSAMFMSQTLITYVNKSRKDTYQCKVKQMIIDGDVYNGSKLSNKLVLKLREGSLKNIKIILE